MAAPWLSILGALVIACNIATLMAVSKDAAQSAVSTGMYQFATEFYKNISETVEGNVICSPISAGIVLAMTAYGARGTTEKKIHAALHLPENQSVSKRGFQSIIDKLNNVKKVQLRVATKMFTNDGFKVKHEFEEISECSFRSAVQSLNFTDAKSSSSQINTWCKSKTNNLIDNVVEPSDVENAAIVLVNAVYFKGYWASKFDPKRTAPRPFHVNNKTTHDVPMMYQYCKLNYGWLGALQANYVELKYESEDDSDSISMFIILPRDVEGLQHAKNNLEQVNFKELHDNSDVVKMNLFLPKFKIENTIDLQPILEKMGMGEIFTNNANFSGISGDTAPIISKMIQKAFIEVDEQGSEAAAITEIGVMRLSYDSGPKLMRVDRPFIYTIFHPATNSVLFQGHILEPTF